MTDDTDYFTGIPQRYLDDYREITGIDHHDQSFKIFFDMVLGSLKANIVERDLQGTIYKIIKEIDEEFFKETGFRMLMKDFTYGFVYKSYSSLINKCFRENTNKDGSIKEISNLITPNNWFEKINDIARSTVICRYADNPEYLCEQLETRLGALGMEAHFKRHSKDRGYYAYHLYFHLPFVFIDKSGNTREISAPIEIQVTTQLQEVLYDLTHSVYEDIRLGKLIYGEHWKWELDSEIFRSAYISHTLHLLESNIVDLRKKKEKSDAVLDT